MKIFFAVLLSIACLFILVTPVFASEEIYGELQGALDEDTNRLLEEFGITDIFGTDFTQITPTRAMENVFGIFKGELLEAMRAAGICLTLLFITAMLCNFLPEDGSLSMMGKSIALMCIMFSIISVTGDVFADCCSSLLLTGDFMLVLIPVFAGVIAFGGNPQLALSFNTVAFSFSQLVGVFFSDIVPSLCVTLMAISAAGAINPLVKTDSLGKIFAKTVNLVMAFVAGIFVAVLSVRGVVAGAQDTVGIRGMRFLVGNVVPVVGSALGEALNSVVAGVSLIKNTVGVFGIAAVLLINLPVLIKVTVWKFSLHFISLAADVMNIPEIKDFAGNMNGVLSVVTGAVCFTSFVFIISIAIILTVGKGS